MFRKLKELRGTNSARYSRMCQDLYKSADAHSYDGHFGLVAMEAVGYTTEWFRPQGLIYGTSLKYVEHELQWYLSQDRCIKGHPGIEDNPVWRDSVADTSGHVNSNYGWCVYSDENGSQFRRCVEALKRDPSTRQAVMYYSRPSMHEDWDHEAKADFICTTSAQALLRDGKLLYLVNQRSSDIWTGFRNDLAWHQHVLADLAAQTEAEPYGIKFFFGSLHCYAKSLQKVEDAMRACRFAKDL